MPEKLLFVNSCVGGKESRTLKICEKYIEKFVSLHKGCITQETSLVCAGLESMTKEKIAERTEKSQRLDFDSEMFNEAKRFAAADYIVIGAPYWDLSFPSYLKIYIENIMVTGLTFRYTEQGAEGMCHAKKLIYITSAGGIIEPENFGFRYIRAIANTLGIDSSHMVSAEGLDIWENDPDKIVKTTIENMLQSKELY